MFLTFNLKPEASRVSKLTSGLLTGCEGSQQSGMCFILNVGTTLSSCVQSISLQNNHINLCLI
ncbi:hypothetical protein EXN66_Car019699 [Channa argus]|uniref:Uncharacterized protein n=1 Tax=Channa argus TaxID=215402 RepID=A0A6G1QMW3_CHAAH|nr:hypothetical protein EXN66_Car019699 [Channa argus]